MGKHTKASNNAVRYGSAASALAVGATAVIAQPATAAQVTVPNSNITFEVQGLENIPNINQVPGITDWVPSLNQQAATVDYSANVNAPAVPEVKPVGNQIVDAAASKIGSPYQYGATGPNAFDCSGLTTWAYAQVGKQIPRTSYAQAAQGQRVSRDELQAGDIIAFYSGASHVGIYGGTYVPATTDSLQPGDIVFFQAKNVPAERDKVTHVGIYTGHGTVIHALNYGTPLSETSMDYMPFHSAVRF